MGEASLFPAELVSDVPVISMTGNQFAHIEQHKGLLDYEEHEIILRTSLGRLCLTGEKLHFRMYSADEAIICGEIQSLYIQGRGKNEKDIAKHYR